MKFWGDSIQCVVHLINRIPLIALQGSTPYEIFFGMKPTYDPLRSLDAYVL